MCGINVILRCFRVVTKSTTNQYSAKKCNLSFLITAEVNNFVQLGLNEAGRHTLVQFGTDL